MSGDQPPHIASQGGSGAAGPTRNVAASPAAGDHRTLSMARWSWGSKPSYTGAQVRLVTNNACKARIGNPSAAKLRDSPMASFQRGGLQGVDADGSITHGRGGSDTSVALPGRGAQGGRVPDYTDVDGSTPPTHASCRKRAG
jgi:hypothetical protein